MAEPQTSDRKPAPKPTAFHHALVAAVVGLAIAAGLLLANRLLHKPPAATPILIAGVVGWLAMFVFMTLWTNRHRA
jgi:uncharacterized membrane protein